MGEATPAQIVRLIGDQMAKSDQQPVMTGGLAQVAGKGKAAPGRQGWHSAFHHHNRLQSGVVP